MLILHHPDPAVAVPAWLVGCDALHRRTADDGQLLGVGDPVQLEHPGPGADWAPVGDGWQGVCRPGFRPLSLVRQRSPYQATPVPDAQGRPWLAPLVLIDDKPAFAQPWGVDEHGVDCRRPTPEQASLLAVGRAIAAERARSTTVDVPFEVMIGWCHHLLPALFHLSPSAIRGLRLLDDDLAAGLVQAAVRVKASPADPEVSGG